MIHQLTYLAVGPTVAVRALAVLVEITLRVPAASAIIQTGHVTYTRGLTDTVASKQCTGECWVYGHSAHKYIAISIAGPMHFVAAYSATVCKKQLLTGVFAATWAIERIWTDTGPIIAHSSIVADKSVAQFLSCTHSRKKKECKCHLSVQIADHTSSPELYLGHGLLVVHVIAHTRAHPYSSTWKQVRATIQLPCGSVYSKLKDD